MARLDGWLQRTTRGQRLRHRLARAAVPLTPGQFILLNGAVIVVGGVLGGLLRRDLLSALILAIVAAILPRLWLRRLEKRRARQFTDQLPNTLRVPIGSLRVGSSLAQAIEAVSELTPEPIRTEFLQVAQEMGLGRPLPETLKGLAERMDNDEVRLMVAAMTISSEVGGNLITILDITAPRKRLYHACPRGTEQGSGIRKRNARAGSGRTPRSRPRSSLTRSNRHPCRPRNRPHPAQQAGRSWAGRSAAACR